ncbi:MAG TPA: cation transporter [Gaiellaceae bacterium]|nr:cation transporter [Gaiellaceae bacterium]
MTGALRRAVELSVASVGWNTVVGFAAIGTALASGSLSLIGFGINAVVDSSVSVLLIRRFRAEGRGHSERAARAEERAEQVAGVAFLLIAVYLTAQAVRALMRGSGHPASVFAIVEAVASLLVLPVLGTAKLRVSAVLASRALRADSMLTLFGAALAAVTCAALLLRRAEGWWWADAVGALVIAVLLVSEAARTLGGRWRARRDRRA